LYLIIELNNFKIYKHFLFLSDFIIYILSIKADIKLLFWLIYYQNIFLLVANLCSLILYIYSYEDDDYITSYIIFGIIFPFYYFFIFYFFHYLNLSSLYNLYNSFNVFNFLWFSNSFIFTLPVYFSVWIFI